MMALTLIFMVLFFVPLCMAAILVWVGLWIYVVVGLVVGFAFLWGHRRVMQSELYLSLQAEGGWKGFASTLVRCLLMVGAVFYIATAAASAVIAAYFTFG